jgi:hypothetical protein
MDPIEGLNDPQQRFLINASSTASQEHHDPQRFLNYNHDSNLNNEWSRTSVIVSQQQRNARHAFASKHLHFNCRLIAFTFFTEPQPKPRPSCWFQSNSSRKDLRLMEPSGESAVTGNFRPLPRPTADLHHFAAHRPVCLTLVATMELVVRRTSRGPKGIKSSPGACVDHDSDRL